MAYQIQGSVIINDSRELLGVNTAGITNDLYVGGNIDASSGVITATQFIGDGSQLTGIITDGGSGGTVSEINVTGIASLADLTVSGVATFSANIDLENNDILNGGAGNFTSLDVAGHIEGDTLNISGVSTLVGNAELGGQLSFTGGDADEVVSGITTDLEESAGAEELVTAEGVKSYVDAQISETGGTLNVAGDSGTGSVDLSSQTFTIQGTSLEVETSASGQAITIGLPSEVAIAGSITANKYYGDGSSLTGIGGDSVDLTGTDQSFNTLEITASTGYGLTVASDIDVQGNVVCSGEIHGPSTFVIDPIVVGDNTGTVVIRGDLVVEGTEFIIDSETLQIADKKIGLATNITSAALLDGSGITIGQEGSAVEESFLYSFADEAFVSSTGLGVTAGGEFKAGSDTVLTSDTLGATVVNSSLTSVGTLTDLTVAGDINANGNIVGDSATNISGINSVTATEFYGDGSNLTGISADNVDLTGTDQSFATLQLTAAGVALTVTNSVEVGGTLEVTTAILPAANGAGFVGNPTTRFGVIAGNVGNFTILDVDTVDVGVALSFTGGDADEFVSGITTSLTESAGTNELATAEGVKDYVDAQIGGGGAAAATINTADNQDNTAYSVSFVSTTGAGASVYTDASQLNYNPSTGLLVAQDFNSLSDIRYKENVETIDGAVDKVKQLRGVEFDWKKTPGSSVGVIAQEVMEIYPQLVTESEEKITVNYNGLIGLLVQAVKEQRAQIEELQSKLG